MQLHLFLMRFFSSRLQNGSDLTPEAISLDRAIFSFFWIDPLFHFVENVKMPFLFLLHVSKTPRVFFVTILGRK